MQATVQRRGTLGSAKVVAAARSLVLEALSNPDDTLRCAAGEALGRMGQVVGAAFVDETVQYAIERIKTDANVHPRTGFSLALGCILRYMGCVRHSTSPCHAHARVPVLVSHSCA
jgi:hypothetical protein